MQHFTEKQIQALQTRELRAIVRSTKPAGIFANEVKWAKAELKRRKQVQREVDAFNNAAENKFY